jgi:hypothetical protein
VKGNMKIILAVLWVLIRKFHIVDPALRNAAATVSDSSELQGAAEKHLIAWVREKTSGLVEITNFTSRYACADPQCRSRCTACAHAVSN